MAYLAKDIATDKYIFDETLFKGAEEKHLKLSQFLSIILHLDIIKNLELDIIKIENYNTHLKNYKSIENFEKKEQNLKEANDQNYEIIVDLERKFLDAFNELKEIQALAESIDCLEEDVIESFK
jgi:hypothetical protein